MKTHPKTVLSLLIFFLSYALSAQKMLLNGKLVVR